MKDKHDKKTGEIFKEKQKLLKGKNKDFQRLHIEKLVKEGKKKTTVSIETLSYEFLALKLGAVPHTREANEIIKKWLYEKMEIGIKAGTYDLDALYSFSRWLKQIILWEIVGEGIARKWWDNVEV